MHTGNAKHIFCDNVTCFRTNRSCSNRSHLPNCFIKALHFLLARSLCFCRENTSFFDFFLRGDIHNTPYCPHRNNSHFAVENWVRNKTTTTWWLPSKFRTMPLVMKCQIANQKSRASPHKPGSPWVHWPLKALRMPCFALKHGCFCMVAFVLDSCLLCRDLGPK